MTHTNKDLRERFPEIDELIGLKDFLIWLVLGKEKQVKQKLLNFLKTLRIVLKIYLKLMIPLVLYGLIVWGFIDAFKHLLNPLGIEDYF